MELDFGRIKLEFWSLKNKTEALRTSVLQPLVFRKLNWSFLKSLRTKFYLWDWQHFLINQPMRISTKLALTDVRIVLYLSRNLSLHSCFLHFTPVHSSKQAGEGNAVKSWCILLSRISFFCVILREENAFEVTVLLVVSNFLFFFFFYPQILAGNKQHSRMWNFTRKRIIYNVLKHSVNWEDKNQCNINETYNNSGILAAMVCFNSRYMCKMLKKKNICLDEKGKILG